MNLLNKQQQDFFSENGFLKVDNFVSVDQLAQLRDLYKELDFSNTSGKMYSNMHDLLPEQNRSIGTKILNICTSSVNKILEKYQVIVAAFLVKSSGNTSESSLHQDWSIVDESKFQSLIVWIPLVDVDETNGCLQVLPGSHRWFNTLRSSNISTLFLKFDQKINPFVTAVPLRAGDAVLFSSRVFHGSKVNMTPHERPAISITIIDSDANYRHYVKDQSGNVKILETSDTYTFSNLFQFDEKGVQDGVKIVGELKDAYRYQLSEAQFFDRLKKERANAGEEKMSTMIFQRIRKFLQRAAT